MSAAERVDPALVVELARGLCSRPSTRPNEKAVAEYLADQLARLGFAVELSDVLPDRPNVVAVAPGAPECQSLLLNGHSDQPVPVPGWSRDMFSPWEEDGVLYGAGIQDMKGGLAALVAGAAALAQTPPEARGDVVVAICVHHDTIGLGTKYFLATNERRIDAAVVGEPTNLKVQLAHGGAWTFEIVVRGLQQHVSRLEEGVDAIAGMVRVLSRLDVSALRHEQDPRMPYLPRMVVGQIQGGTAAGSTAGECVARGDVRYPPGMTPEGMRADLQRMVDAACAEVAGLSGGVRSVLFQRPYEIASEAPVVRAIADAHAAVLGAPAELTTGLPAGAFITDAADIVRHGIPTAVYGPGDWRSLPDEGIAVRDLVAAARVYAAAGERIMTTRRL